MYTTMKLPRRLLFLPILLAGSLAGSAQITQRACGTSVRYQELLKQETFAANMRRLEDSVQQVFALQGDEPGKEPTFAKRVTIPVYIHVLYNAAKNGAPDRGKISQAQAQTQIDVLNHDYNPQPADRNASAVPTRFKDRFGFPNIRFSLAKVVYIATAKTTFSTVDDAKSKNTGGDPVADPTKYLNIWVVPALVNLQNSPLLGYSSWPSEPADKDGVVIISEAFGKNGTVKAPFDLGRTATHEIGHWLNLHHLWGDDDLNAACTGSDFVDDTPTQSGPNYTCPSGIKLSCKNKPDGDMYVNYMDYPPDACMSMFSAGQVMRMRTTLDKIRTTFLHP